MLDSLYKYKYLDLLTENCYEYVELNDLKGDTEVINIIEISCIFLYLTLVLNNILGTEQKKESLKCAILSYLAFLFLL